MIAHSAAAAPAVAPFVSVTGLAGTACCLHPNARWAECGSAGAGLAPSCMGGSRVSILLADSRMCVSRHARSFAQALAARGVRCVICAHVEDPFATHCVAVGVLPITLADMPLRTLMTDAEQPATALMTVDLEREEIVRANGLTVSFQVDAMVRHRLLRRRTPAAESAR